ncbi:MAG: helix-turn-helix transcriptional regulator, partial [Acidobacteriota bacterium]
MFYNELWLIMIMEKSIMDFHNMGDKAILEELGERVMRQRLNRDITQADLAENAGISRGALQRIERGD